jgi:hypothetical protein
MRLIVFIIGLILGLWIAENERRWKKLEANMEDLIDQEIEKAVY